MQTEQPFGPIAAKGSRPPGTASRTASSLTVDLRLLIPADQLLGLTLATVADLDRVAGWPPVRFPNPEGAAPGALMAMLVYGYATGRFGSEEIAEEARRDRQLAYLAAGQLPSSPTLRRFRRVFRPVVTVAMADLLGRVATLTPASLPADPSTRRAEAHRRLELAVMADAIALDY